MYHLYGDEVLFRVDAFSLCLESALQIYVEGLIVYIWVVLKSIIYLDNTKTTSVTIVGIENVQLARFILEKHNLYMSIIKLINEFLITFSKDSYQP